MSEVKVYYNDRLIANPEKYFGVPVSASERNRGYVRRFPRRKAKRNRRQAISFDTRVHPFRLFYKVLSNIIYFGARFGFIGFFIWCGIKAYNIELPKSEPPKAEAQAEWVDTYPKVIGLLKPQTDLFDKYFNPDDARIMRAVCQSESGMEDKRSHKANSNGTYDWGRCQINEIHAWRVGGDVQKLLDPETNIRTAKQVFEDREDYQARKGLKVDGFEAWTCYKNGSYKQYLGN